MTIRATTVTPISGQDLFNDLKSAIHISFPSTFYATNPDITAFTDGSVTMTINGAEQADYIAEVDARNSYSENCLLYLCYLLEFTNANTIEAGAEIIITIDGQVTNPVSINDVDEITVTTAAKYEEDERYYFID